MSDWRVNTTAEVVVVGERRGGRQAKAEANIFGPLEHTLARCELRTERYRMLCALLARPTAAPTRAELPRVLSVCCRELSVRSLR